MTQYFRETCNSVNFINI